MVVPRALVIWIVIMVAETLHAVLRTLLLQPVVGDFKARQIAVFTGSAMIVFLAFRFIRWIGAASISQLLGVGLFWLTLTVGFEMILGRVILSYPWERITSDYNLLKGGLMPIGLIMLTLSPWIAAKTRRINLGQVTGHAVGALKK
jgi:hypothetical protein